jgi:AraC-like DNA-binding protein
MADTDSAAGMAPVTVRRTEFASGDVAELREVIDQGFGSRLRMAVPRRDHWRATLSQVDAGEFVSVAAMLPADLTFTNDGRDERFVIDTLLEGGVSIERGKAVSRYQPGDTFLGTGPRGLCTVRSLDARIQAIVLPRSLLTAVAATASDQPQPGWEFSSSEPANGGAQHWRDAAHYVDELLSDPEAELAPLVIGSAARLLAATALAVFANTAVTEPSDRDRRDAHPQTLRRAVAFIEEHAHQNISAADIAAAACVTTRAVQIAFRRYLDTTPLEYLRRVRLDRAHHELLAADPARDSVTAVAYRWGFSSPSRFAARYRQAYGVPPGRTLRS